MKSKYTLNGFEMNLKEMEKFGPFNITSKLLSMFNAYFFLILISNAPQHLFFQ